MLNGLHCCSLEKENVNGKLKRERSTPWKEESKKLLLDKKAPSLLFPQVCLRLICFLIKHKLQVAHVGNGENHWNYEYEQITVLSAVTLKMYCMTVHEISPFVRGLSKFSGSMVIVRMLVAIASDRHLRSFLFPI